MRDELCGEIHKQVDERLIQANKRLTEHDIVLDQQNGRINKLEVRGATIDTKVENLCDDIKTLVSTIRWAGILAITTLLGFFIWYIQHI